ncbi:sensor histidine kinase [Nonomuraea pusilla]|uniref:histidine kinase n=1 Tax=Nonomuraea pusilla TaxID=46177 RepID=A0A1H7Q4J3_9ACTN|nr:ATP-binding protein [Nonomuraea pusilla]SEL42594.1 two-component system, OmpR family, sensor histidine kinase BaeS [Nonomuraea pusilla]
MRSLFVRLLTSSAVVAVCSITATAWLAASSTSGAIQREQGQTLASDAQINNTLLGYAARHPDWSGVAATVRDLAARNSRRIALTTEKGTLIADSAAAGTPLPSRVSAVVDPLAVDVTLVPGAAEDRIDPRAVGPFLLSDRDRARLTKLAATYAGCMRRTRQTVQMTVSNTGRPSVTITGEEIPREPSPMPTPMTPCDAVSFNTPTRTEKAALKQLNLLVAKCLKGKSTERGSVGLDFTWVSKEKRPALPAAEPAQAISSCIVAARKEQLDPYVAPAAYLYIGSPAEAAGQRIPLPSIAGAALLVLVLTVGVSVMAARRLVGPVNALTHAARRMRDGDSSARVQIRTTGEISELATAFNEMSEHLQRMEEQRKAMVSDVSHELRTPLSNLRGWLEAAQDGVAELDPALIASLVEEILLLQHIVDDLQDLALADAGRLYLHLEPVCLGDLLDQVTTAHRGRAEAAGLTLTTEVTGAPTLIAAPVRLRQAIGNLVTNSLRYTPPGGHITLSARQDGDHVIIEVTDTGIGIRAEHLPHVFDRFWRAEKSRNRRTGGSGLGLAIVRDLAEAHGGTATVTSTPGVRTTFTLRLPSRP